MMDQRQEVRWTVKEPRKLVMTLFPFASREEIALLPDAVDISKEGLGIVVDRALTPGFVVFRDGLEECMSGVIVWTKERGDRSYRAGVRFIPAQKMQGAASSSAQNEAGPVLSSPELREDPELFASVIMDAAERGMVSEPEIRGRKSRFRSWWESWRARHG